MDSVRFEQPPPVLPPKTKDTRNNNVDSVTWVDGDPTGSIKLGVNQSRGYVVSILVNPENHHHHHHQEHRNNNNKVVEVPALDDGGATTVLHVSSSREEEAAAAAATTATAETDQDVGRISGTRVKISVGGCVAESPVATMVRPGQYFYFPEAPISSSGLSSPSDTTDSGAGSDFDGSTPPPLPKRKQTPDSGVSITSRERRGSVTSGDEDSISCDSLNSSDLNGDSIATDNPSESRDSLLSTSEDCTQFKLHPNEENTKPQFKLHSNDEEVKPQFKLAPTVIEAPRVQTPTPRPEEQLKIKECTYEERASVSPQVQPEPKHYYEFHLNENQVHANGKAEVKGQTEDEVLDSSFAGVRNVLCERGAIRSAKGTVRGVKNRVRAGIATFLQLEDTKSFKEREEGKLVVYTTTMGVVRSTYLRCVKVKQILRTLLVKFEERDVFMSRDTQQEVRMRMKNNAVVVPQVFLDGHHLGDADTIERLNESGELRRLLRPFKCPGASTPCATCGGYRLLPCTVCNGSKKSVHRNHFTLEFVALKCMTCDESGLVRCHAC